jgi:RNA polymerase sigma-70 factor, ECF subfamily
MAVKARSGRSAVVGAGPDDPDSGVLEGLLGRVARGDEEAFAAVYDKIAGPVYGAVHRTVRDTGQAQELTQEVLMRVWRSASRFSPSAGSGLSWVLGLTRQYVAHQRGIAADGQAGLSGAQAFTPAPPGADAGPGGLPATRQRAVALAVHEGRTVDEIGQRLGVPRDEAAALLRNGLLEAAQSGNL